MKALGEFSQINRQQEKRSVCSGKHTHVHLTHCFSKQERVSIQIETWWQCAVIDSKRRGLMGGFCQRLITAVSSTHKTEWNWETETHLSRCTGTHTCTHFQSKLLVAPFIRYKAHLETGKLQRPLAQTAHQSLSLLQMMDIRRCKITLSHIHTHTHLLNIHWSEFGVMNESQQWIMDHILMVDLPLSLLAC